MSFTSVTNPSPEQLELERLVMARLTGGDGAVPAAAAAQHAVARVTAREHSGVGFFTHFEVPTDAPRIVPPSLEMATDATLVGVGEPVGFLLFVRDGVLSMLEGFVYGDGAWPERPRLDAWAEWPEG